MGHHLVGQRPSVLRTMLKAETTHGGFRAGMRATISIPPRDLAQGVGADIQFTNPSRWSLIARIVVADEQEMIVELENKGRWLLTMIKGLKGEPAWLLRGRTAKERLPSN